RPAVVRAARRGRGRVARRRRRARRRDAALRVRPRVVGARGGESDHRALWWLAHTSTLGGHMRRDLDQTCIDTLRFLAVEMVEHARSGHPGLPLGAAPMAYVLWARFLRHNPSNPR